MSRAIPDLIIDCFCGAGTSRRRAATSRPRGGYFVLQLHDELIYETTDEDVIQVCPRCYTTRSCSCVKLCFYLCSSCQVAQIVKREMETAVKLYVKLKAKVKVGPSWGNLQDLDI